MKKVLAKIYVRYLTISSKCKIVMAFFCNFGDVDKFTKLTMKYIGEALAKMVVHGMYTYDDAERLYYEGCEKLEQFKNMIYGK